MRTELDECQCCVFWTRSSAAIREDGDAVGLRGLCRAHPTHVVTDEYHWCGEFKESEKNDH